MKAMSKNDVHTSVQPESYSYTVQLRILKWRTSANLQMRLSRFHDGTCGLADRDTVLLIPINMETSRSPERVSPYKTTQSHNLCIGAFIIIFCNVTALQLLHPLSSPPPTSLVGETKSY
jgi:hypothetical protein